MLRELVEGLVAELDGTKTDAGVALRLGRMQMPQSENGLAVALLIESDDHAEPAGIVVLVGSVIHFNKKRRLHAQELHAIVVTVAIGRHHDESPSATDPDVDLVRFACEAGRAETLRQMLRIRPGLEHQVSRRRDHARQHDLAIDGPNGRSRRSGRSSVALSHPVSPSWN